MAKRALHPAFVEHGKRVKAAHAHLAATVPWFKALPGPDRMRAIQEHVRGQKEQAKGGDV